MANKIVILGAGESGVGAALLAKKIEASVWVSDAGEIKPHFKEVLLQENIPFEEGGHTFSKLFDADLIIKSPGIPEKVETIQRLRYAGKAIISEIEFASQHTDAFIIAVTGSNGKTTTASLIFHLLQSAKFHVGLAGNIGKSFAWQVATQSFDYYVLEVSSFQLDDIEVFHPNISILMNITPDHLDRYEYDIKRYAAAKFRIAENQLARDTFIYCIDDPITLEGLENRRIQAEKMAFSHKKQSESFAYLDDDEICYMTDIQLLKLDFQSLSIKGLHNAYNVMAAVLSVQKLGMKQEDIQAALETFKGVEHRMEWVANIEGVDFINDTKATNTESAWFALDGMTQKVVWIVGGQDKGNDYTKLVPLAQSKVKAMVVLGEDKDKFFQHFEAVVPTIVHSMTMADTVEKAFQLAHNGDCVLLSPACASFDLFENYAARGRIFKEEVQNLA